MRKNFAALPLYGKIDRNALARRRKNAIALYCKGWTQYRIAKHICVSFEAVSNWVEAYEKNGMQALESLGRPGPKSRGKQEEKLKQPANIFQRMLKLIN
jgi:transposase